MIKRATIAMLLLTAAAGAHAGRIDFTDSSTWGGANGQSSHTVGNVTLSAQPSLAGAVVSQGSFGLGIDSLGDIDFGLEDEVNRLFVLFTETLTVSFATPTVVRQIELLNLFEENGYLEQYAITVNPASGPSVTLTGGVTNPPGSQPDGLWIVDLASNLGPISSLNFYVPFLEDFSDYSVGAIVTPLPAAVWLFGSALLGLFGIQRGIRKPDAA